MFFLTDDLLKVFVERDTITLSDIRNSSEEELMKTILDEVHSYKITPPKKGASDQRWFTYIPDKTCPNGRKRVAKKTQKELFIFLLNFYGISENSLKGSMSFGEVYAEWVEYKKGFVNVKNKKKSRTQSTITRYKRDYKKCFADTNFDKTPIECITSIQIELAFKDAIEKNDLSESYTSNLFGYIKNTFEYAFRQRYIATNEFLFVDKDRILALVNVKPPKKDSERILTASQQKNFYEAIKAHEERYPNYVVDLALELAMQTGMRAGELAALHWSDLHDGYIHIDFSEHRIDHEDGHYEFVIGEPKNLKHRKFPFNPAIEDIFRRVRALGRVGEFVFTNEKGERQTGGSISCASFNRGEECGIEKASVHRIRRTVASELRKTYSIKMVSELLGHLEETDEEYYNYNNAEEIEKFEASNHLCSNVLNFEDAIKNKKTAKAL